MKQATSEFNGVKVQTGQVVDFRFRKTIIHFVVVMVAMGRFVFELRLPSAFSHTAYIAVSFYI